MCSLLCTQVTPDVKSEVSPPENKEKAGTVYQVGLLVLVLHDRPCSIGLATCIHRAQEIHEVSEICTSLPSMCAIETNG